MTDHLIIRVLSLYFSRNSVAPEKAICVIYSSTSSAPVYHSIVEPYHKRTVAFVQC